MVIGCLFHPRELPIWAHTAESKSVPLPSLTDGWTWVANMTDAGFDVITKDLLTTVNPGDTLSVTFFLERDPYGSGGGALSATFLVGAAPYSEAFDTTTQTVNT